MGETPLQWLDTPESSGSHAGRIRHQVVLILVVLAISLLSIYILSGTERDYLQGIRTWHKQAFWTITGLGLAILFALVPLKPLIRMAPWFYLINLGLVLAVKWIGVERNGALSWIQIGPLMLQPSEPMKLMTMLLVARILGQPQVTIPQGLMALLVAAVPSMVIAVQPDLGTALVFPPMVIACLYGARISRNFLALVLSPAWALWVISGDVLVWVIWGCGVGFWAALMVWHGERLGKALGFLLLQILLVIGVIQGVKPLWNEVLKPHQRDRLVSFIQASDASTRDLNPASYHLRQSLIAISSGGLLGQGHGQGLQSTHGFIPMMRTDFIFALLAEEMGFVGCTLLLGLLLLLLLTAVQVATFAETWGESQVVYGILGVWTAHVFINIGMTMGLSPITGIPLPFLSYGGSATLANYLALGWILSVARRGRFSEDPFR